MFRDHGLRPSAHSIERPGSQQISLKTPNLNERAVDDRERRSMIIEDIPEFSSYRLAWSDEFHGPAGSSADPQTWLRQTGGHGWGNQQLQYYTDEAANAALDGIGHLRITVNRTDPETARTSYDGREYTSARLASKHLRRVRYGLITARIKLPRGRGIWPAFWLLGEDIDEVGWPHCGEIDVMENFSTDPAMAHGAIHGPGYSGADGIAADLGTGSPLADDYREFSVCWEPGRIRWYYGSELYHTVTPADLSGREWVFDHDFFLLLNVAVGSHFFPPPDASVTFPQHMLMDYVRIFAPP
jgi:beta-glucanase (GH16 family)